MEKGIYFKLQLKRALKIYPAILLITVITLSAIAMTGAVLLKRNAEAEGGKRIKVGIVGDLEQTHLGIGVEVLENLDSSRFTIEFKTMEEQEAITALKNRTISGYVDIPPGFIRGIVRGENVPAKYVTLDAPDNFGSIVMNEIAVAISNIITESQNGLYSMQSVAYEYEKSGVRDKTGEMNMVYIDHILNRNKAYDHQVLDLTDSLSLGGYYVCGIVLFFLMIWGISCDRLLGSRNLSLSRSLKISGVGVRYQMLCEYASYLVITVITLLIIAIALGMATVGFDIGVKELDGAGIGLCVGFVIMMLPVVVMITAMHTAFYELVSGAVSRILVLFMLAVGLGYISGCFYPSYFFPEGVQKIASVLPTGVGFGYIKRLMSESLTVQDFLWTILYAVGFLAVALFARNRRIAGERL